MTWITTTEAAQRLGVKRATLYAYVSRGLLHSARRPGRQESLFDRAEIDALAATSRASGAPQSVLRFRSVASAVTSHVDGDLLYRGVPIAEVVTAHTVESGGAFVVGAPADPVTPSSQSAPRSGSDDLSPRGPAARTRDDAITAAFLGSLPLERRLPAAVQALAAADPFVADLDPDRVRRTALSTIAGAVRLLPAGGDPGPDGNLAATLVSALRGGGPVPAPDADLMRVLLLCLLDHGLAASTVAARVAASARAGLHDCLAAAYAAMSGPLHGAAPIAAQALIADPRPAGETIAAALRRHGGVPGFGHFLYPGGDPRADVVLEVLWRRRGTTRLRRRVEALAAVVADRSGALPNCDFASAAALHALGLPAESGEVVFQVARSYGVAAHVVEEYAEQPLRWRARDAVG
jgi:citrate synthase